MCLFILECNVISPLKAHCLCMPYEMCYINKYIFTLSVKPDTLSLFSHFSFYYSVHQFPLYFFIFMSAFSDFQVTHSLSLIHSPCLFISFFSMLTSKFSISLILFYLSLSLSITLSLFLFLFL